MSSRRDCRLVTTSPVEGLKVSLAAYKSLISDYSLRAKQAEAMVALLMASHPNHEALSVSLVNTLREHLDTRGLERSTQLLGVLQTTLLALTEIRKGISSTPLVDIESELTTIVKALTVSINPN